MLNIGEDRLHELCGSLGIIESNISGFFIEIL